MNTIKIILSLLLSAPLALYAGSFQYLRSSAGRDGASDVLPQVSAPLALDEQPAGNGAGHGPNAEQAARMELHNLALKQRTPQLKTLPDIKFRPYADYEKVGYLIINYEFRFSSKQAKQQLAAALPEGARLVVLIPPSRGTGTKAAGTAKSADLDAYYPASAGLSYKEEVLTALKGHISPSRISFLEVEDAFDAFWARDAMPIPVFDKASGKFTVIDALYYHGFSQDKAMAQTFNADLEGHDYYYEGGNFMANHLGACVLVNNKRHAKIPDAVFSGKYGCSKIIRLPHRAGIGHIDEHARFINATTLVTDLPEYKETLEKEGFKVAMLPRPANLMETYVNSVLMGDNIVVPVFGQATDKKALEVYKGLRLNPFKADSYFLSNNGSGSVHCITMTYPEVPAADLARALGGKMLN